MTHSSATSKGEAMTYLDKLASALDAAGIAYIRHERSVFVDDPDTQDAVLLSEDGGLWVDKGVKVGSVIGRAIVTAAEVWREMQEGEGCVVRPSLLQRPA